MAEPKKREEEPKKTKEEIERYKKDLATTQKHWDKLHKEAEKKATKRRQRQEDK